MVDAAVVRKCRRLSVTTEFLAMGTARRVVYLRNAVFFSDSVHLIVEFLLSWDSFWNARWPTVVGHRGLGLPVSRVVQRTLGKYAALSVGVDQVGTWLFSLLSTRLETWNSPRCVYGSLSWYEGE